MSHVRQQIRQAVAAALDAALAASVSVHVSRTLPVQELPAALVYTNDEQIERRLHQALARELELVVELLTNTSPVDDSVDEMIATTEATLNQAKLGGLCKPLSLGAIAVTVDTAGAAPVARARLTYRATYFTEHGAPEAPL